MKFSIFNILVLLILSSCGGTNQVVSKFNKQRSKYTKGLHFVNKKQVNLNEETAKIMTHDISKKEDIAIKLEVNQIILSNIRHHEKIDKNNHTNSIQSDLIVKCHIPRLIKKTNSKVGLTNSIVNKEDSSTSDVKEYSLFLLVILAFLIPFLAVGLKTNWDLVKVLIAFLLWTSIIFSILFALLVVYDILEF